MTAIVGMRRAGKQIKAVQEQREVTISTSMRLEDLMQNLQLVFDEADVQDCIDPPMLDIEIRNSYGDLHLHSSVFWYRPVTEAEQAEYDRLENERKQAMREAAKETIKATVKRNPDVAREALAELEQES